MTALVEAAKRVARRDAELALQEVLDRAAERRDRLVVLDTFVAGKPAPQGSKSAPTPGVVRESSPNLHAWRKAIGFRAVGARTSRGPVTGPLRVHLTFLIGKAGRGLRPPAAKRPDLDKLVRAVFDALTGVIWVDDSQPIELAATKRYTEPSEDAGVHVRVEVLG